MNVKPEMEFESISMSQKFISCGRTYNNGDYYSHFSNEKMKLETCDFSRYFQKEFVMQVWFRERKIRSNYKYLRPQ
jgi:hypothetical protein